MKKQTQHNAPKRKLMSRSSLLQVRTNHSKQASKPRSKREGKTFLQRLDDMFMNQAAEDYLMRLANNECSFIGRLRNRVFNYAK